MFGKYYSADLWDVVPQLFQSKGIVKTPQKQPENIKITKKMKKT